MPLTRSTAEIQAELQRRRARPAILTGSTPTEPDDTLSIAQRAGDVLLAPIRGVEAAVQDVYGLADKVAMDALPDWEERVFGESKTGLGGLVEGVVNFGVGMAGASFIPLGWTAKLGRLAPLVRGAVKGAVADFAVFDGNEERLSNLLQSYPSLQNPVSEFLAARPDDGEIEGRFKNALEGLGLGAAVDLAFLSLKGLRAARSVRAAGGAPDAAEAAFDKAAPPKQMQAALEALRGPDPTLPKEPNVPAGRELPAPVDVLRSFDIDEAKARELLDEVHRRSAPFSHATLTARDPLDPRINPRNLTAAELLEQGMQRGDLNLSRYQGPDGPLDLIRAMEQLVEPLKGTTDIARREFTAAERESIKGLGDMVGTDLEGFVTRGKALAGTLNDVMAQVQSYRLATLAQTNHAYEAVIKASRSTDDKDLLRAMEALETDAELTSIIKSFGYSAGRGLRTFGQKVPLLTSLLDREGIEVALHDRGGRKRALDLVAKAKAILDSTTDPSKRAARLGALTQGAFGRRTYGVLNEWWYNSLLGRPTTLVVNAMSGLLTTIYRPLESIVGGAVAGNSEVIQDGVREISSLVHSASDAWQATVAALRGDGQLLDPRSLLSDIHDPARKAISTAGTRIDPESVHGQAIDWLGKLVRLPSAGLTATDQFFQQLNFRAVARSQITKDALKRGVPADRVAAEVAAEMDKLMFRGQAYGQAQLYHRGVEEAVGVGLRGKAAVDEYAREFVTKRLTDPAQAAEHSRLSSLGAIAQQRAQEATFTAPLTPGTLPYRVQEAALNHWYVRLVMPFVRTPINILGFAHQRSTGLLTGVPQLLASKAFPSIAPALEGSRNAFLRDMLSGDPRRVADAKGRLALGSSTMALVLTKAAERDEDGLPMITGRGPADRERRRILEDAGWQPYSIRVGDRYVSYSRLDPFASIIGTAADIVNFSQHAATEDQDVIETLVVGQAVALASNLTNKTYLSGLANAMDMLTDPQHNFRRWAGQTGGSFVPGALAAAVTVSDPLLRDVRSIMDASAARVPGLSDDLPPLRNVLGEPVRRAQSLGSDISSVTNAFVPLVYQEVSDDAIAKEMALLKHGFTPPKRIRGGLDLTGVPVGGTNAFDRWLELHGQVEIGGRTLRQALRRLIGSRSYQRIPPESTVEVASPRIGMIQSVIEDYRARALQQLIREVPALGDAERARTGRRAALLQGRETRPGLAQQLVGALTPRSR